MRNRQPTKVALINFHFAHNYGAVLQALALQEQLQLLGASVETIDYRPRGHWQQYAVFPNPLISAKWKFRGARKTGATIFEAAFKALLRGAGALRAWANKKSRRKRFALFESFVDANLRTTRKYKTLRALRKNPPNADLYLAGSDQIWNPANSGGIDPAYFLQFGEAKITKATYAASPCQLDVAIHAAELKTLCSGIDFISVREQDRLLQLEVAIDRKVMNHVDPVLLMTSYAWQKYMVELPKSVKPYLLLYAVRTPQTYARITRIVEENAGIHDLEIVDLSLDPSPWPFPVVRPDDMSPNAFVSYIANAKFVVSNSFHASVFALIFQREFVVVTEHSTSSRLNELLDQLELTCRIDSETCAVSDLKAIDYRLVDNKIAILRRQGISYLKQILDSARAEGQPSSE